MIPRPALWRTTIQTGVQLQMLTLHDATADQIAAQADGLDAHDLHADAAMFGGADAGKGMANLIRALALLAHAEGGVDFDGLHFCTDHAHCLAVRGAA